MDRSLKRRREAERRRRQRVRELALILVWSGFFFSVLVAADTLAH